MIYLGDFAVGSTIYIPFATYDKDDGSSITMTGFAVTDIEIYKNGNTTQRASDNGVTLLDTDGTDFDGITGIHGFSIDTSDSTTSGFFVAGADYWVVVSAVTVDSVSISFIAGIFSIENRRVAGELVRTTIGTLSSQTSFTLTSGSADNDAYNNCTMIISDQASGIQKAIARISDYDGSTRTITLAADPGIFTMAAGDNVSIIATSAFANLSSIGGTAQTARDMGASVLLSPGTGTGQVSLSSGAVTVGTNNDKTGFSLSTAGIAAIFSYAVEGTRTFLQWIRLMAAEALHKSSGGGTTSITFRDAADTKARISATVDSSGNRTTVTLDGD